MRRSRWAPLLLLAGAGVAASLLLPKLPREHGVGLRLPEAATVTGVDVAWTLATDATPSTDPVQGSSWHFVSGSAPPIVETRARVPDGRYALDVIIERGASREAYRKVIAFGESDHIVVTLR